MSECGWAGRTGRRDGPGSNPTAGTIDPRIAAGQFSATPAGSGGRASQAAPSHGHPRLGRQDPSQFPARPGPVPRVAEDASAPQRPLYDTVAPQRVPISWAIRTRAPLWDRGRQRGQSEWPLAEPQSLPVPNRSPDRAGPGVPGEASRSPGTAAQGGARPGATFHASFLLARTLPCTLGEASPGSPVSPAARFGCGFLSVRFRSRAVQENPSLPG